MTIDHVDEAGYGDEGAGRSVSGRVLAHLVKNRGVMISVEDGARAVGVTPDQFTKSVAYLAREKGARLDRPAQGFVVFHRMPEEDVTVLRRRARGESVPAVVVTASNGRRGPTITDRLKALLEANVGHTLSIDGLAKSLGCAYNTVIQTASVLRTVHGWNITSPVRGSYLYLGDRPDAPEPAVTSAPLSPVTTTNQLAPREPGRHVVMDGTGLLPGWAVVGVIDQLPVLRDPQGVTYRLSRL